MKGVRLSVSPFSFSLSDLLCLRSTKYNAPTVNYLLVNFFLHFDLKLMMMKRLIKRIYTE